MEPRAQRQAIRDHLSNARAALDRGDRAVARAAVEAALALDPEYLAARALLERIDAMPDGAALPKRAPVRPLPDEPPVVSAAGWARFEQRTRIRRIERRAAAARDAIARGRLLQAKEIVAEIREIDPAHPELISLSIELDAAEHQPRSRTFLAPMAIAACAILVLMLGAGYVRYAPAAQPGVAANGTSVDRSASESTAQPISQPTTPPITPPATEPVVRAEAASTSGVIEPPVREAQPDIAAAPPEPARPAPSVATAANARIETPAVQRADRDTEVNQPPPIVWPPVREPRDAPQVQTAAVVPSAAVAGPSPVPTPLAPESVASAEVPAATPDVRAPAPFRPVVEDRGRSASAVALPVRDDELVRQVLQQYRVAYETLDAKSAQRVWPAVDGVALQRAFDGLQSQHLNFDDCSIQVRGASGSAVCRGSARYVPKVGSREPRVEPRVWRFGMRKSGETWEIVTARAER